MVLSCRHGFRKNKIKCKHEYKYSQTSAHLDSLKELEVEDGEDGEGDEGHPHEVGDEDVVPRVREAQSHLRGADPG